MDGTIIAVKQLSAKSRQGYREFLNEIGMISCLQHPNLVKLYGCCVERKPLLLVYEYLENNSLARALFGKFETRGYMAPEYAMWGYLTFKADVYSFGVVALEIVAGKNNMKYHPDEDYVCLLDRALVLQENGNLMELIDPRLGSDFDKEQALKMIEVALLCTNPSPVLRPSMSEVVNMLEGSDDILEHKSDQNEMNSEVVKDGYDEMPVDLSDSP
nr:probable leucine-rich repeat receptor-like serine/threonine-protein kinase At3g14840 [Ipomoea batatas]